jgi:hypothetical protein
MAAIARLEVMGHCQQQAHGSKRWPSPNQSRPYAASMDHANPPTLPWRRRLRRRWVALRSKGWLIPLALLLVYAALMFGLTLVADLWIVGLAATPLLFALLLALGCLLAYRRDFYA